MGTLRNDGVAIDTYPRKTVPFLRQFRFTSRFLKCAIAASLLLSCLVETSKAEEVEATAQEGLQPQFSLNYQTLGDGLKGVGQLEGLFPLFQSPGTDLWFLQGGAQLDTAGQLGGNLLLGYRAFNPGNQRVLGGYLGLDAQGASQNTFYQLGAGFESLGADWELRGNVYLPVGNTDTGQQLSGNPFFQDSRLLLPVSRQVALAGGDLDLGLPVANLGDWGNLWAYGGLYYYTHAAMPGVLGGRIWLTANPTNTFQLKAGVQHDSQYGTNLLLQASLRWGGAPPANLQTEETTAVSHALLGQFVQRAAAIRVAQESSIETAINPATGQPYRFLHVSLNPVSVSGTDLVGFVEVPYGAIGTAGDLSDTALGDALFGDIVYVQPGQIIGGFTIPDGVQVLSTGPQQSINTQRGVVLLPGSGAGEAAKPSVTGTIFMGNQTVLSGFAIQPGATQDGVQANAVTTVTVRDNTVTSARNGILFSQVRGDAIATNNRILSSAQNGFAAIMAGQTGTLTATQNRVENSGENGLLVLLTDGSVLSSATLTDNSVMQSRQGGMTVITATGSALDTLNLARNQVIETGSNGVLVLADTNSRINQATLSTLMLDRVGANGVLVQADNGGRIGEAVLTGSQLGSISGNGMLVLADRLGQIDSVNLSSNQINQTNQNGVLVLANRGSQVGSAVLAGNTLETAKGNGILIQAEQNSRFGQVAVSDSTLQTVGSNGILVSAQNNSQIATATVQNSIISQTGENGVLLLAEENSQLLTAQVIETTVGQARTNGILLLADQDSSIETAMVDGVQVSRTGENAVLALANNGSQIGSVAVRNSQIGASELGGLLEPQIKGNGILLISDNNSQMSAATVEGNQLAEIAGTGILAFADHSSSLTEAVVNNNQIETAGEAGVLVFADNTSNLKNAQVNNNRLTQLGAEGIQVFANRGSQINQVEVTANQITQTTGVGIQIFGDNNSRIQQTVLSSNQLQQIKKQGIMTFADNTSTLNAVTLQSNALTTVAQQGLQIFANQGGEITNTQLIDNRLDGIGAEGIMTFAETTGRLDTVAVDRNQINTVSGNGISLFATNGGTLNTLNLVGNQVQTIGNDGAFVFADGTSQLTLAVVRSNTFTGVAGDAFELGNSSASAWCAVMSNNSSIGTANFDVNLFTTGSSTLQIANLAQLNADNNNTFTRINNNGATSGTQGTPPCP
ncbi:MAG TPA: right-handed parallel beta-helix repeat-containing protein [Leptolyngbyaceae cyanobacterium]